MITPLEQWDQLWTEIETERAAQIAAETELAWAQRDGRAGLSSADVEDALAIPHQVPERLEHAGEER